MAPQFVNKIAIAEFISQFFLGCLGVVHIYVMFLQTPADPPNPFVALRHLLSNPCTLREGDIIYGRPIKKRVYEFLSLLTYEKLLFCLMHLVHCHNNKLHIFQASPYLCINK